MVLVGGGSGIWPPLDVIGVPMEAPALTSDDVRCGAAVLAPHLRVEAAGLPWAAGCLRVVLVLHHWGLSVPLMKVCQQRVAALACQQWVVALACQQWVEALACQQQWVVVARAEAV